MKRNSPGLEAIFFQIAIDSGVLLLSPSSRGCTQDHDLMRLLGAEKDKGGEKVGEEGWRRMGEGQQIVTNHKVHKVIAGLVLILFFTGGQGRGRWLKKNTLYFSIGIKIASILLCSTKILVLILMSVMIIITALHCFII